jgi:extracellular elastinolytic metalloproteinase
LKQRFIDRALHKMDEPHDIGEVWAAILNQAYWSMVKEHGFSENIFDSKQPHGNIAMLQLVMAGMTIQPCNPIFVEARDAILSADLAFYSGKYACALWAGFAQRGLGVHATNVYNDSFMLPAHCKK